MTIKLLLPFRWEMNVWNQNWMRHFKIEFFKMLQIFSVSPISVSSFEGWLPSMKWKMHNIISIINSLRLFSWHNNLVIGLVACMRGGNYRAGLMRKTIYLITSNSWSTQTRGTFNPSQKCQNVFGFVLYFSQVKI